MERENEKNKIIEKMKKLRLELQSCLNDNYLWVSNSIRIFKDIDVECLEFEVPKTRNFKELRTVKRSVVSTENTLNSIINSHIYYSSITYLCALVDDFLIKTQKLLKDNWDFFELELKEEIVCINIDKLRLDEKFNLQKYCRLLNIDYEIECWEDWNEIKATRNIIVHNKGIINQRYLDITGVKKRGRFNEKIVVDTYYFMFCIATLKSLIGKTENFLKNKCMKKY